MGVLTTAAIIGAVGAVGGAAISANGAKVAANKAADANSQATSDTNQLNLDMFNQSRGSAGSAVLPTYFGNGEAQAASQAYANFQNLQNGADQVGQNLLGYQNQLNPSVNASLSALAGQYNGQNLQQQINYSQPVWNSAMANAQTQATGLNNVAQTQQAGINIGLAQALAQQNAQRTAQGYLGGSTFDRNRAVASTIGAQQTAAGQLAQAQASGNNLVSAASLQNAQQLGNFQLADLQNKANLAPLSTAATNLAAYQSSPYTTMANLYTSAQQPLNFFRIGTSAYNQPFSPQVTPQINSGQVAGAGLTSLGQVAQNYFSSQQTPQQPAPAQPSLPPVSALPQFNSTLGNVNLGSVASPAYGTYGGIGSTFGTF